MMRNSPDAAADPRDKEIGDLKAALLVLDVTIYAILPFARLPHLIRGQIFAARNAYEHATGDESMIRDVPGFGDEPEREIP